MTDQEKKLIKYKKQYLYLVNKITRFQLSGENPPERLIKQAHEVGRKGEVPEAFCLKHFSFNSDKSVKNAGNPTKNIRPEIQHRE
jgi:hypothetical protein